MIVTVGKTGTGEDGDNVRADVDKSISWQLVEERETEFVIELLN